MLPKFYSLFLLLCLIASNHSLLAQPALNIAPAGQQSILFWTNTPVNYVLLSSTNVASANWVPASDAATVTAVTVSNTSPARFFRLTNSPAGMALIPAGSFVIGDSIDGPLYHCPTPRTFMCRHFIWM